jgi:hypothetical protein
MTLGENFLKECQIDCLRIGGESTDDSRPSAEARELITVNLNSNEWKC